MNDEPLKLKPIGVTYSGEGVSNEVAQITQARISKAATLGDLCDEYEFYTPALIHIGVRLMNHDPYVDFLNEQKGSVNRISIRFGRQIFQGMDLGGNQEWNYVLYGIEKFKWSALRQFMGPVSFIDRDLNVLHRIRTQELEIADPLYFDRVAILPAKCPMVKITAFVLDSSNGCMYLASPSDPVLGRPWVIRSDQAFKDTEIFAQEVARNGPDPYQQVTSDIILELEQRVRKDREQHGKYPGAGPSRPD